MAEEKYAVVSTVDVIKKTYIIPMSQLQAFNTEAKVDVSWAADTVTMGDAVPIIERFADEVLLSVEEMNWEQVVSHVSTYDDADTNDLKIAVDNCLKDVYDTDNQ